MKTILKISWILACVFGFLSGQSIVDTKHNLSVSGTGDITATSESEICIFCHTPHQSGPQRPLWNREDPGSFYTIYSTSTTDALTGQPDGSSILCLSCHDGTIALGNVLSRTQPIEFTGALPINESNLSTDLSNDHPISFIYNSSLASSDGELVDPSTLTGPVHLENQKVQCISCHNPHDEGDGLFLVATRSNSELCLYCHQKDGWSASLHNLSAATQSGVDDPWPHTPYTTVAENACENCHNPHNAGLQSRLTNYQSLENNCLVCHNGNVASLNIEDEFLNLERHDIYTYTTEHDPREDALVDLRHIECVDCHNPHYSSNMSASAPLASGSISGVPGIDSDGNALGIIQNEYELCYRCHTANTDNPVSVTLRQVDENDVREEFDLSNPSYHPVEDAGVNPDVPSLITLTETSVIYCTDCHASDNTDVAGPHGSIYPQILKYRYETDYGSTVSSETAYELCFQCHDFDAITNTLTTSHGLQVHNRHIMLLNIPCNVCHDPHGISSDEVSTGDHTHLINFDISVVDASSGSGSSRQFIDDGNFSGQCYLRCHGSRNHNPLSY